MIELDLRDIHLPESLPWWPPAPGWWVLMLLLCCIAVLVGWWLRSQRRALKRHCLRELSRIQRSARCDGDTKRVLAEVSMLLRRVAISRLGRQSAAGLSGADWRACIVALSSADAFDERQLELLSRGRFQRSPEYEINHLLTACDRWIRALPRA